MDFHEVIDRKGTYCTQWDFIEDRFGKDDLLPFTISDTDFALPKTVLEGLTERLEHGIFGYTRWNHADLQNAIKKWYNQRFSTVVEKEWLAYSPSVIYSISQLIRLNSSLGDGIVVQTPAYDAFFKTIKENGRQIIENPLLYHEGQYTIDFIDLEQKLSAENVTVLLFCSPHNPTGRVWTVDELGKVVELCKKYSVFLISDEIHMDVLRKGITHHPIVNFAQEQVALVTSGSKTFNFPGLIFSYVLIPDRKLREEFLLKVKNQDGLSSASTLGMEATMTAYNECNQWVDELNNYIDENIDYVEKLMSVYLPEVTIIQSESTYLMWLDMSKFNLNMSEIQERLTQKGKVAIMDGGTYGGNGHQFLRLNIGCPREKLADGLSRMFESLK